MNIKFLVSLLFLLLPTLAMSQTNLYAGLSISYVDLGQDASAIGSAAGASGVAGQVTSLDDGALGWSLFAGYRFTEYLSAEVSYADLGDTQATFVSTAPSATTVNMSVDVSAFAASIVGMYPMNRDMGVFVKLGGAYSMVDGSAPGAVSGITRETPADDDGFNMLFGLGGQYHLSEHLGLRLEWNHYNDVGDADSGTEGDINVFAGSVMYRF